MRQDKLFTDHIGSGARVYNTALTVSENSKGVLDVDTVKGCTDGLKAYPTGGCYGECYAYRAAKRYGIDFSTSVSRKITSLNAESVLRAVKRHYAAWYRVGVAGDPSYDWENTLEVFDFLKPAGKVPVIVTKHWKLLSDNQIARIYDFPAVVNTSVSALDTDDEIKYRVSIILNLRELGIKSICRVVTCKFGNTAWAKERNERQLYLLSLTPVIDTPLRFSRSNSLYINGDIITC